MHDKSIWHGLMLISAIALFNPVIAWSEQAGRQKCQIAGRWACIGKCIHPGGAASIREFPGGIKFFNEAGGVSSGVWFDPETVVAVDWENGLKGDLSEDCNTIVWRNGTTWVRR